MKHNAFVVCIFALSLVASASVAQQAVESASAGQKTLAATMNVYVFPTKGQTAQQQSTDEATCYSWAVQNTGTDPFDLQKQAEAQKQQAQQAEAAAGQVGAGAGAKGALGGAAAGTVIGAIAGDTGKGAAYGAAAGLVVGHRRQRMARHEAKSQVQATSAETQQATANQIEDFKKAFSVCLEANNYMVKF